MNMDVGDCRSGYDLGASSSIVIDDLHSEFGIALDV